MKKNFYLSFFLIFQTHLLLSQTVGLVKEIAKGTNSSNITHSVVGNNKFFFSAVDFSSNNSKEFWVSNGQASGTYKLPNSPGIPDRPRFFFNANGTIYFGEQASGEKLWKVSETSDNMVVVSELPIYGRWFVEISYYNNGITYIPTNHPDFGFELWRTDGTTEGTFLLKDIYSGNTSSYPKSLVTFNGLVYFLAQSDEGYCIWKTDGTKEGTVKVTNASCGVAENLYLLNNKLIVEIYSPATGYELGVSDGVSNTITLLKDINSGSASAIDMVDEPIIFNNKIYFAASDGNLGKELWVTDGTSLGTYMVKDINTGSESSDPIRFEVLNSVLYFSATTNASGRELWRSDGTEVGTYQIKDVYQGTANSLRSNGFIKKANNLILFEAQTSPNNNTLWRTDGTSDGTYQIKELAPYARNSDFEKIYNTSSHLYFTAKDLTDTLKYEVWVSDGTANGTKMLKELESDILETYPLHVYQDEFYFSALDSLHGFELWKTNGTSLGIKLVKDVNTYPADAFPKHFMGVGETIFFFASDAIHGNELWKTNTRTSETTLVKDFTKTANAFYYTPANNASSDSHVNGIFSFNNYLYVLINGRELWKFNENGDGTLLQTFPIEEYYAPCYFAVVNNMLYIGFSSRIWKTDGNSFSMVHAVYTIFAFMISFKDNIYFLEGNDLWKLNTQNNTASIVKNLKMGEIESTIWAIFSTNNRILIHTYNSSSPFGLWTSDGTTSGTKQVLTPVNLSNSDKVSIKNEWFFTANNGVNGYELWKTDGLTANMVKDIYSGPLSSGPGLYTAFKGRICFIVNNPVTFLYEFWITDGTEIGTTPFDVFSVIGQGVEYYPSSTIWHNNRIYFYLGRPNNIYEIWSSDGTTGGTVKLYSFSKSIISPEFNPFSFNGKLYFGVDMGTIGNELYVLNENCTTEEKLLDVIKTPASTFLGYSILPSFIHISAHKIEGANLVETQGRLQFNAKNYTLLTPGFETKQGSVFVAKIQNNCNN